MHFFHGSPSYSSLSSGFCCLKYSRSTQSLMAIFLMYTWTFIVLCWIVVVTLTSLWPPSFRYSLRMLKNPPCMVRCFLILMSLVHLLLWPPFHPSGHLHLQGIGANCPDLVLPIQQTLQAFPYTLSAFGGCSFPSSLFLVTCLWDSRVLSYPQSLQCCFLVVQSSQLYEESVNHRE